MSADQTLLLEQRTRELCLDGFTLTVVEGPSSGATLRARVAEVSVGTALAKSIVQCKRLTRSNLVKRDVVEQMAMFETPSFERRLAGSGFSA